MPDEPMATGDDARTPLFAAICGGLVLAGFAWVAFHQISDGRVLVDEWGTDATFILDIILRISAGEVPHRDFALHLGALPYLMAANTGGATAAQGFLIAQAVFVGGALLAGLWIWRGRLTGLAGPLLLGFVFVLGMTVSIPTYPETSLALFYNRWGWVLALLFASLTLLPPRRAGSEWIDGLLAGVLGFVMLMVKVTFVAGLLPAALLATALRGQWREIGWGLAAFLLLGGLCMIAEPAFLPGYVENIAWVAANPLRPNAGTGLSALLSGLEFVGYTIVFAVVLAAVARTRGPREALVLFIAAAGFYFIQYQNYLTAPFWVLFLAVYATARIADPDRTARRIWTILATALLVFAVTLLAPMTNGLRGNDARAATGTHVPFPENGRIETGVSFSEYLIRPIERAKLRSFDEPAPWTGNPECVFLGGWAGAMQAIAETVAGLPGPAFIADSISPHWFLAGVPPVRGVAVWNYGSVRGIENADYVLVPVCAIKPDFKREILREIERQGLALVPEFETEHVSVYRIAR